MMRSNLFKFVVSACFVALSKYYHYCNDAYHDHNENQLGHKFLVSKRRKRENQ